MRSYTIVVTKEPDGSAYNVSVPALQGCFTFGATLKEAVQHAKDAIQVHIESLIDDGEAPPEDIRTLITTVQVIIPDSDSTS
jgi:antitoxin HicB